MAEGTDLRVRVGGRRWISACGRHNLPDGEVFTGPHEDATEGVVTFAMPSAWGGQRVEGARLRFEAGRCVEAEATSGGAFLRAALDTDEGARTLGEFAFGLNEAITGAHARHAPRREDRRHGAHGARRRVRGHRRHQRERSVALCNSFAGNLERNSRL